MFIEAPRLQFIEPPDPFMTTQALPSCPPHPQACGQHGPEQFVP